MISSRFSFGQIKHLPKIFLPSTQPCSLNFTSISGNNSGSNLFVETQNNVLKSIAIS